MSKNGREEVRVMVEDDDRNCLPHVRLSISREDTSHLGWYELNFFQGSKNT